MKGPAKHLDAKHFKFVRTYVRCGSLTQAAIEAGYSEKTAAVTGSQLAKNPLISAQIKKYRKRLEERYDVSNDKILKEYARIGFSDLRNYLSWGNNGVEIMNSDFLTADESAAIKEVDCDIEVMEIPSKVEGEPATQLRRGKIKIKTHDKKAALDALAKLRGMGERAGDEEFSASEHEINQIEVEIIDQADRMIENASRSEEPASE